MCTIVALAGNVGQAVKRDRNKVDCDERFDLTEDGRKRKIQYIIYAKI